MERVDTNARSRPTLLFAELGKLGLGEPFEITLQRVAELAGRVLPEVEAASITFVERNEPKTVGFSSPLALRLDERQYESGSGPCLSAAVTGQTVVVDVKSDESYPEFVRTCRRTGISHAVAVRLLTSQQTVGALNLFAATSTPLSPDAVALAGDFAEYAAVAVANSARYHEAATSVEHIRSGMQMRAVIEQAKGMLMAAYGYSPEEAFRALQRTSRDSNRGLHDVAQLVVEQVTRKKREP